MNIEIFLHHPVESDLVAWLGGRLGPTNLIHQDEKIRIYATGSGTRVTLTPRVDEGRFVSVFMVGNALPWPSDQECARDAADALSVVVRSVAPGQDQRDIWFQRSAKIDAIVPWDADPR